MGALARGLMSGIAGGIRASKNGMDFWDGDIPLKERVKYISNRIPDEQWNQAGLSEVKLGEKLGNANGRTTRGIVRNTLADGEIGFSKNTIELSKSTVRKIWNGRITGFETLNHELQHATDFSSGMYSKIWNGLGNTNWESSKCVLEFRAFYMSFQRTGLSMYQTSYKHWYNRYYDLLKK